VSSLKKIVSGVLNASSGTKHRDVELLERRDQLHGAAVNGRAAH
jgi:hypothetical protein